ncbi:MAG: ribose-phosphate pyrophosphokinase [Candidatus Stahlbacteria bacterium]|nr:ribose-phosphate pyrophosphokinase [Candidatus Stahlbacteria bacterium]
MNELKVFTGNSIPVLAKRICEYLDMPLSQATVNKFVDGEVQVKLGENVRGVDVFIVQSTYPPAENLFELLLMIDAAHRASAGRITAVIPYFGYSRQDKKNEPRVPISAKLVANLIATAGADRVVTLDLHADQIQGFFDIPVDHLYATPVIVEHFKEIGIDNLIIVAPDVGGAKRAEGIARRMGDLQIGIINKRRPAPDQAYVTKVVGEANGKDVLIVDDIISTGGTIVNATVALKQDGANRIYCYCTHPVLADTAYEKIEKSLLSKMFVTDTIPLKCARGLTSSKIEVLSVSNLLGKAILQIHRSESISSLLI